MLKNNQISNAQKPSLLTIGLNFYVSLSLLLGTMPALANEPSIIADPSASNRPDILKAPNETLIINITNPDSKGVSINEYSRFNTPPTGTILNNSNKNIDTKIAGQIDANYRLTKEASLIINKVNSAKKSSLKGNLEVAGSRADVVIANPNGISVDGLNMINSRSLTLTTGNINKLSPKEIELISDKSIDIVGDGLNDKSSDYTNVISNAVNLNSNIYANELNIIGEKAVASSSGKLYNDVKAKNQENSFSLDSSALGGMYANKIKLVGTSNGVGVNNNGLVIANNKIEISLPRRFRRKRGDLFRLHPHRVSVSYLRFSLRGRFYRHKPVCIFMYLRRYLFSFRAVRHTREEASCTLNCPKIYCSEPQPRQPKSKAATRTTAGTIGRLFRGMSPTAQARSGQTTITIA